MVLLRLLAPSLRDALRHAAFLLLVGWLVRAGEGLLYGSTTRTPTQRKSTT